MTDTSNMPTFECHKIVHALEVLEVGNYKNNPEMGRLIRTVHFTDGTSRDLTDDIFRRYLPEPGDFYVVYDNGEYESFSPRKAFLNGYSPKDSRTFRDIKDSSGGYPAAGGSGSANQHPKGRG